ncbi:hypothetical protein Zm00014a_033240 [Zea mays]|uniref:Ubiquitin-like protease family profile domain-containing protein n=1 Tax=Zea mays TaxID=4577 RepID=A0A3L6DJQ6_MAIZE|nr:hypothetical protein Zm00014a_033240 [Zea mays]
MDEEKVDVGTIVNPSFEVMAGSGCSAQILIKCSDTHELDNNDGENIKDIVGNVVEQSLDVVAVGNDPVHVSAKADVGEQPNVTPLSSLDVQNESTQISSDVDTLEQIEQDNLDTLIRICEHNKPKKLNVARVLPKDYTCTTEDLQLIEYIKSLPRKQVVVLSAYIHSIRDEEHILHREGGKVFLESTFISSLLKRDGDPKILLNCKEDTLENRVDNYLQADMVFIPINIENFHWYLAIVNAKKNEVHILDSMGPQITDRRDLYTTNDITKFRFKLPAILWNSRLNTKKGHQETNHHADEDGGSSCDVEIIKTPCELPISLNASSQVQPFISSCALPATLTSTNTQELMSALCTYIMEIDDAEYLEKHWIQSTKPYPISLSLQQLKNILDVNKPMDKDCFNIAVRMIACSDALFLLENKYHYMDLQFCSITNYGQDPRLRAKLDTNVLANLFECWPDMEYTISDCSQILLPFCFLGHFSLYVFNMNTRSIYIMDSMPLPSWFKGNDPNMHYIHKIHNIANNMNVAIKLANPTWKDDIYMWRRIVPSWVPKTLNWDLSGFLVINFMHSWNGKRLPCISTTSSVLRTKFLVELMKYQDNECNDNIPEEIQKIIKRISV